jgi:hypothetical protein
MSMSELQIMGGCTDVVSAASFASALTSKVGHVRPAKMLIQLREDNTNSIDYQILGSMDRVTWFTLKSSTTIVKNGSDYTVVADPWFFIDVQIRDTVGGTHGKLNCIIGGF